MSDEEQKPIDLEPMPLVPTPAAEEPDEEEDEAPKGVIIPRKGVTVKEAQRALKKFQTKLTRASEWAGAADFGKFLIGKGKKEIAVALQVYAADALKKRIENIEELKEKIDDPELKVRLEENVRACAEGIGKIGATLAKDEPAEPKQTNNSPGTNLPPFPPNTQVNVLVHTSPEK